MKTLRLVFIASLVFSLVSCVHRSVSPEEQLVRASQEVKEGAPARTLALAGFHAFLLEGNADKAQTRFEAALKEDPGEPYALYGQLVLARRSAHPEAALEAALALCERAPQHPLSSVGARFALELAGATTTLDDQIVKRAQAVLAKGAPADTAHLLRTAVSSIEGQRAGPEAQRASLTELGIIGAYSVYGPFFAHNVLSFDAPTPPERDGSLKGPFRGPYGDIQPRTLSFADGRFNLGGEVGGGDGYILAVDVEVPQGGAYFVRSVSTGSHKVYLNGTLLFQARAFEHTTPAVFAQGVELDAGRHRLIVRVVKEERANFSLALIRADGRPSDVTFVSAQGPATQWSGAKVVTLPGSYPHAQDLANALTDEAGELLANDIAARDGLGRDPEGTKALLLQMGQTLKGAALHALRADLDLTDHSVPSKVARGRATRDLEAALDKDPKNVNALLSRAAVVLEDGRPLEASEWVKQAKAATKGAGYPIPLMESRIQLALGVDAQAEQSALEALKLRPGLCEALSLRYDLARRRDAITLANQLEQALRSCPGHFPRRAEHARLRGDLKTTAEIYSKLSRGDPGQLSFAHRAAEAYVGLKAYGDAERALRQLASLWPRNPLLFKRLADVAEHAGKRAEALALREQALALDGSDLALRRTVERAKGGKELLSEYAIDAKSAIAAYEADRGSQESAAAYVLDAAAIVAYPDGSMVDRIHTIQKALDPSGVSEIAEVNLPPGAQVLTLRTIKKDGRLLEPESIEGKETISMPGVSLGDYVEQEFLLAHPARGPTLPGFTASNFYYQIARQPNAWSTYTVVAPKGTGLAVDAHNVSSEKPLVKGDREIFSHEERHVPPFLPEPEGAPSPNEYLPFVSVGAGTQGQEALVSAYADAFYERGQRTFEVDQFAKSASEGKTGLDAAKALYAAVMDTVSGRDLGITASAAASLAHGRGSRLWLLKASLESVGIPTRVVAIRSYLTDPAPYRFPTETLLPYVCLRADIPGTGVIWMDPTVRFGPFGELPEHALGKREAWLLPEPQRALERTTSPERSLSSPKTVELHLNLAADGKLSGTGIETYHGMEAARLYEALEAMAPDQRNQALQSALSRYFGGAELANVTLDMKREVGAPLTLRYAFVAPRFAHLEGGKLMVGALTFPAQLGRRYVQLGSRKTALFIDETEHTQTQVDLTLPPGFGVPSPVPEIKAQSRFGTLVRRERIENGVFKVDELYRLDMARVPPAQYEEFAQFAGDVDLIQARDFSLDAKAAASR